MKTPMAVPESMCGLAAVTNSSTAALQLAWTECLLRSKIGDAEDPSSSRIFILNVSVIVLFAHV
eukprot:SAG31_NODE_24548_length_479_cov_0.805263_1_plen_63_part_01